MKKEPFVYDQEQPNVLFLEDWMKGDSKLVTGFTTKLGGGSKDHFASQNLGLHVGDDAGQVVQNRVELATRLGFAFGAWTCANQTHGTQITEITEQERGRGGESLETALDSVDGLYTKQTDILLTSYYADCVPLFFYDPVQRLIGVAHAGWRGTVGQIGLKLVNLWVEKHRSKLEDIRVAIGPAIGGCCYEVGDDVFKHIEPYRHLFSAGAWTRAKADKYLVDLKQINADFLSQAGILRTHIEVSRWCTSCNHSLFFSHRKDKGRTGRMAAFIALKEE